MWNAIQFLPLRAKYKLSCFNHPKNLKNLQKEIFFFRYSTIFVKETKTCTALLKSLIQKNPLQPKFYTNET